MLAKFRTLPEDAKAKFLIRGIVPQMEAYGRKVQQYFTKLMGKLRNDAEALKLTAEVKEFREVMEAWQRYLQSFEEQDLQIVVSFFNA